MSNAGQKNENGENLRGNIMSLNLVSDVELEFIISYQDETS